MKKILVTGAGGFIGTHLVSALKKENDFIVGVDIKDNEFTRSHADIFIKQDLSEQVGTDYIFKHFKFDEVYNLAAVMGGMEFLANGKYDYRVLNESTQININVLDGAIKHGVAKAFWSSSACIYNYKHQETTSDVSLKETVHDYPSLPDLEYGWQKLFSERLYMAGQRCNPIQTRIARFHNVYGQYTEYDTEKAKAPAALCRKVAIASDGESIEVWGDGLQTRSFMWVEDCIVGIMRLMRSGYPYPINIGSDELIAINDLAKMIIEISGKDLSIKNVDGAQGVRGRNSDNYLIWKMLNWKPNTRLSEGIPQLYSWVNKMVNG